MDERIKYLMYGLAFGRKLPVREKEPGPGPDIPVESITLIHDGYIVGVNRELSVYAIVNPENATHKEVSWGLSDYDVAEIISVGSHEIKLKGTSIGETTLTCYAGTFGEISASAEFSVSNLDVFDSFIVSTSRNSRQNIISQGGIYVEAYYEPRDAELGGDWGIDIAEPISGDSIAYSVENTGVSNLRKIVLADTVGGYEKYASEFIGGRYLQKINTKSIDDVYNIENILVGENYNGGNINYFSFFDDIFRILYGVPWFPSPEDLPAIRLYLGQTLYFGIEDRALLKDQFYITATNSRVEISGLYITTVSKGECVIELKCGDIILKYAKLDIDEPLPGSGAGLKLIDTEKKLGKRGNPEYRLERLLPNSGGMNRITNYRFDEDYFVSGDIGAVSRVDGRTIKVVGQGSVVLKYKYFWYNSDAEPIEEEETISLTCAPFITSMQKRVLRNGETAVVVGVGAEGYTPYEVFVDVDSSVSIKGKFYREVTSGGGYTGVVVVYEKTDDSAHTMTFNVNNIPGSEESITI